MGKLKIAGKHWDIKRKPISKKFWGRTIIGDGLIEINTATPEHLVPDIVGHEIVHVWLNDCGWEAFMNDKQVEAMCDIMGKHLSQLILSHTGDTLKDAFLCRKKK